ncbi:MULTISPECIES: hypothetical protein [unclassified Nostoc]|uniref:hypothetical protein n=1 Tax=unclassified Nostoc TaxID=2593658 RepID=UPI002AD51018|nr:MULTISPECIES: hypothetical protein [unclassified Nostoc]MDZ7989834.1 hypothetical protein [Nostoc sp. DedVER02]MDZ8111247.1 hypothetical protein [Nostoc sp. DedVER01b]
MTQQLYVDGCDGFSICTYQFFNEVATPIRLIIFATLLGKVATALLCRQRRILAVSSGWVG